MGIYQRGENWYIDFTYRGKRYREAVSPDEDLARDVLGKRRVEIRENRFFPEKQRDPDRVRFHDFAKQYRQWSIANKKPSAKPRETSILRVLDKEFGQRYLDAITSFQVEAWKMKRKKEVKPATVNRELAVLKGVFARAIEWGKMRENPARTVKLFKGTTERLRYLLPEEVRTLISNCADHIRPIVTVAVHTGMRKGEVLGLRRDQVSFDRGIITLTDTKNSTRRDIPMNETVKATLRAISGEDAFFFASSKKKGKPYVWIEMSFHRALEKSGIQDFKFHDLRHTFASNLVMAGEDINTVGELLGHKRLEMTKRYAHLSPAFKKRAVGVLDRVMSQKSSQDKTAQGSVVRIKP